MFSPLERKTHPSARLFQVPVNSTKKYTFTTEEPYNANSPLQASGLLGPVTLNSDTTE
jgi:hypothetical protein